MTLRQPAISDKELQHRSTSNVSDSSADSNGIAPSDVDGAQDQQSDPIEDVHSAQCERTATPTCEGSLALCIFRRCLSFYKSFDFPINLMLAIALARAYPPLGAEYLKPDITSSRIAVAIIFLLSGMGLRTEELGKAFQRMYFNGFVQLFNFGVVSIVVFAVSRFLSVTGVLNQALADGMVICAALPMAINIVIVLTASAKGDEVAAIFNATFGNVIGIFLSPLLILMYLGASGDISLGSIFYKLTMRVILPFVVGQLVQKLWKQAREFYHKHKPIFKKVPELALVYIVYCVFCKTFENDGVKAGVGNVFLMILFQFLLMVSLMVLSWYLLKLLFRDQPELRVMGVYGCTEKTVSLGIPLISAIYEGNPNEALYTLPILIWHPMQLVVGSLIVSRLAKFVEAEHERLRREQDNGDDLSVADVEAPEAEDAAEDNCMGPQQSGEAVADRIASRQ